MTNVKELRHKFKKILREDREWLWPSYDVKLEQVFDTWRDINKVMEYVTRKKACIQAGGAVGVFPWHLADRFEAVYTFEPDYTNFQCLVNNIRGKTNIYAFNAALGHCHQCTETWWLPHETGNAGALHVKQEPVGQVPMLMIDDFSYLDVGLIYLDIEGFEALALAGGIATLTTHQPVVAFESKGLHGHFKSPTPAEVLKDIGYERVFKVNHDEIYVCQS